MPGWASLIVGLVQQIAEEEGLLLGLTLAGYAVDLWWRQASTSRSLRRIRDAPELSIAALPALLGAEDEAAGPAETDKPAQEAGWRAAAGGEASGLIPGPSRQQQGSSTSGAGAAKVQSKEWRDSKGGNGPLVIVRGKVQPAREAVSWTIRPGTALIKAENSSEKGVVVERINKIVCSNWHQWFNDVSEHQVELKRRTVPFELADFLSPSSSALSSTPSSAARVRISLDGLSQPLPLVTVYSSFQKSTPSITSVVLHLVTGSHPIGQKVEERLLPPNTELTAVGRARRDKDGRPVICPASELPVFLTPQDKEQLVRNLAGTCTALASAGLFVSIAAVATFGFVFWRKWDHRRRAERARRLLENLAEVERRRGRETAGLQLEPPGAQPGRAARPEAEEEDEDVSNIGNGELCVVCLSRRRKAVFIPCGHLVCCWRCAQEIKNRTAAQNNRVCPVCRCAFQEVVRVYGA